MQYMKKPPQPEQSSVKLEEVLEKLTTPEGLVLRGLYTPEPFCVLCRNKKTSPDGLLMEAKSTPEYLTEWLIFEEN